MLPGFISFNLHGGGGVWTPRSNCKLNWFRVVQGGGFGGRSPPPKKIWFVFSSRSLLGGGGAVDPVVLKRIVIGQGGGNGLAKSPLVVSLNLRNMA